MSGSPQMLSEILERFNRKERNLLVRDILGHQESKLCLTDHVLERLRKTAGPHLSPDAWWATDFHFDWLFAAVMMFCGKVDPGHVVPDRSEGEKLIQATQQDVDLVIAEGRTLLLIEAKAHGAWSNAQFGSKRKRLEALRKLAGDSLDVNLLLMSPKKPQFLNIPTDFKLCWLPFKFDKSLPTYRVTGCSVDGKVNKDGAHWKIVEKPASEPVTAEEVS